MKKKVGENLRLLRLRKGYTQLNLAESVYISESTYKKIESGNGKLDIELLDQILKILEVDFYDFLFSHIIPPPQNTQTKNHCKENG